jgi:predicted LPLAT superfamily acyltransferase
VSATGPSPRNPGPSWGYAFLLWAERWWPRWLFRTAFMLGTWVALPFMAAQRKHSRDFLALVLARPPRVVEVWRHFFSFADFLLLKLRVARGVPHRCTLDPQLGTEFSALLATGRPALFGTFHFGHSDLLGFYLGETGRRISMIRLKVGNSDDTRLLGRLFGKWVSFIWVNDPAHLLFALKAAIDAGDSLAMKCDRLEFSAKAEPFHFLDRTRLFPFTIYHLAVLFDRPVAFCLGVPGTPGETRVLASPVFVPNPAETRAVNLRRARTHFQGVLTQLESLVRQHPALWFNFIPLNPEPSPPPAVDQSPHPA